MNTTKASDTRAIQLDGQPHPVTTGTSLADLVASLGHAEQAVATAVNQAFVSRRQRAATILQAGDQVVLFQPIVGG